MGVRVDANDNPQLMLYALGALNKYDVLGDFDTYQPYMAALWKEVSDACQQAAALPVRSVLGKSVLSVASLLLNVRQSFADFISYYQFISK
jgi:hypothetical protein